MNPGLGGKRLQSGRLPFCFGRLARRAEPAAALVPSQ